MKKAIILASSRGIGKAISDSLAELNYSIVNTSSTTLDTANLSQVENLIEKEKWTDILVLNTGGPPSKDFYEITKDDWIKYFNQLFLSFCLILQKMEIKKNGYVFLISSFNIKEPNPNLILSNSYRIAFVSVLKSLSKIYAKRNISCINIAPGPIKTDRLIALVNDINKYEESLPMGRAGRPEEIGKFVKSIIENEIKYLNGVTINFDGGKSNYVL
ncbi:MAG TPA: SDR family oxidoreductase [Melioribacteraceae bacterium]|nr:SDR family oxidoreductase [Melioribacteraceae bacterium]